MSTELPPDLRITVWPVWTRLARRTMLLLRQVKLSTAPSWVRQAAAIGALAIVYYAAGNLGLVLAVVQPNITLAWPPVGVALAALWFFGYRLWPGIALGSFLVATSIPGTPPVAAVGIAAGNALQALAAVFGLRRCARFDASLSHVRDVLCLVGLAVLGSTTLSATIGVTSLGVGSVIPWADFPSMWFFWWLGDAMGLLTVAPLLLTWGARRTGERLRDRGFEALALGLLVLGVAFWIFGGRVSTSITNYPLAYVIFPFGFWAAFRFGARGAATFTFTVAGIAIWETLHGYGPFASDAPGETLVLWYVFAGVVALTSLITAATITERRLAEHALQQSESRYRNLFTRSPISIWEEDFTAVGRWLDNLRASGVDDLTAHLNAHPEALQEAVRLVRVLDVNEASVSMFQAEAKSQLLGGLQQIVRHDSADYFAEELLAIWEGRHQLDIEVTRTTLKGNRIDYILHWAAPVENGRLDLAHVIVAISDITERKRAEEESNRVLHFLETLINNTPAVAIQIYDREGRVQLWNPASEALYGHTAEEMKGRRAQDTILLDEDIAGFESEMNRIWQTQQAGRPAEYAVRHKDGSRRHVYSTMFPLVNEGQSVGLCCMDVDITERKRAEEDQQKLVALVENSGDLIALATLRGQIFYLNEAGRRLVGLDAESDLAATALGDLLADAERASFLDRLRPSLSGPGRWQGELQLRHLQTGRAIDAQMSVFVVRQPRTSEPLCLATVTRDITQQKLLEGQFRQAQKMEAVGRLAGGIAHDFNNLLMAILGYSDLLLSELPASNPLHHEVRQIRNAGERAAALTTQLLAFSRKQMLQARVLDLNAVVEDMDHMLQRLIGEDIELVTRLDPALGRVKADRSQIEQVVVNLVINARDAMPKGGKLSLATQNFEATPSYVQLHPGLRPGRYVLFSISDTGCGMSSEVKQHLFEPFFTTKSVGKGTGLGLSTVYGILKQSGGDIQVYSEETVGTTVKIYLPRVDAPALPAPTYDTDRLTLRGTETILLAEDEDSVRDLLRRVLRGFGYTVIEATNGAEALRAAEHYIGRIHIVLTDVVMPQMGGRELVARLTHLFPGIKVLYVSGYTDDAVVNHGVLDAQAAFLQKPFDTDTLLLRVRKLLDHQGDTNTGLGR
jgi:PAS domain S-box-containing protein